MRSALAASTSIILLLPSAAAAAAAGGAVSTAFLLTPYGTRRRIPYRSISSSSACRPPSHLWMVDDGSGREQHHQQQQQQPQRKSSKRQQKKQQQGEKKRRFVQSVHPVVRPATRAEDNDVAEGGGGGSFFRSNDSPAQGKRFGAKIQEAQRRGGGVVGGVSKKRKHQQRGGGSRGGGGGGGYQQQRDDDAVGDQRRRYGYDDDENDGGEYNMDDPRKNPMLRHSSSIEELETIMMKRWGTKMDRWQADLDDGEWEIVENDDDDENGGEEEDLSRRRGGGSSSSKKAKAAAGGIFRGRPVLDPWQEDEKDTGGFSNSAQQAPNKGVITGPSNKNDVFGEDAVLDKVRRNQERMKKKREERTMKSRRPDGGRSSVRKVEEERQWQQKRRQQRGREEEDEKDDDTPLYQFQENDHDEEEFYDEDDEGYEVKIDYFDDSNDDEITDEKYKDDDDDNLYDMQSLIAPKPAGGKGRNQAGAGGGDDATITSPSPGFFFTPPPDKSTGEVGTSSPNTAEKEEKEAVIKSAKKQKSVMIPTMLDEDGNEMYLTVNQARSDLEKAISSTQTTLFDEGDENNLPRLLSTNPSTDTTTTTREWTDLGITTPQLLSNLQSMRCTYPLYVQDQTCPIVVSGNDVLVSTQTGSGKTLAFLVPLVERLLFNHDSDEEEEGKTKKKSDGGVKVLILAPGRELASQIASVSRELLDNTGLTVQLAIGGTPYKRNLDMIRKKKPDILIGTPGRIAELVVGKAGDRSGRFKINSLQSIVLDEFDALLEYKPHREPTNAVVKALKKRHGNSLQSILCSATASDMLMNNGEKEEKTTEKTKSTSSFLSDFVLRPGYAHVDVNEYDLLITPAGASNNENGSSSGSVATTTTTTTTTRVSRTVIHGTIDVPHKRLALDTLRKILHTEPMPQQVLVFVDNSRRVGIVVDKVKQQLADMGIIAAPLHGGSNSIKTDRAEVSKALRDGYVGIVVATEMAARGIDAPYLTHVINLDLPTDSSHYAHRAGRCGRGGRAGVVINITTNGKERNVPRKFGDVLGVRMYTVEARSGKLRILEE